MYISGTVLFCLFMYFWSRDKERTKQLEEIKQSIQNQSHTYDDDEYDGISPEVAEACRKQDRESYKFLDNLITQHKTQAFRNSVEVERERAIAALNGN